MATVNGEEEDTCVWYYKNPSSLPAQYKKHENSFHHLNLFHHCIIDKPREQYKRMKSILHKQRIASLYYLLLLCKLFLH
uniref:Uncharacterized protein n=1 Tax=Populus trichocarpa TaxID=3694 RepID=A0A2K2BW19_POPTR